MYMVISIASDYSKKAVWRVILKTIKINKNGIQKFIKVTEGGKKKEIEDWEAERTDGKQMLK